MDQDQHRAHVQDWLEAMVETYATAAEIGISVGHVAEWYLERWWQGLDWAEADEIAA